MKAVFTELLNGLSADDLILMAFRLFFTASLFAWIVFCYGKWHRSKSNKGLFLIAVLVCFVSMLSHYSVPLAVIGAGAIIASVFFPGDRENGYPSGMRIIAVLIGFGCGSGFIAPTLLLTVFILTPYLYFSRNE
ncbi:MAG: hypothetical protein ACOZCO_09740 [Bacteroidota bacterium]